MLSNKELRRRARINLGNGIFTSPWLYGLAASAIVTVINMVVSSLFTAINLAGVGGAIVLVILGPLNLGLAKYYLYSASSQIPSTELKVLFDGFKNKTLDNVVLGVLITIFTALWSILLIVPGIVKSCSYALSYYIKCDCPQYSPKEVIKLSQSIMNGHKMRYFKLQLSFIGWHIVSIITCGLGYLWLIPYIRSANAEFYRDLILNLK